jgi:hypothetical protein
MDILIITCLLFLLPIAKTDAEMDGAISENLRDLRELPYHQIYLTQHFDSMTTYSGGRLGCTM